MSAAARSTRREFLKGQAAADALVNLTGGPGDVAPSRAGGDGYLVKLSRRAMACQFEFYFNAGQYDRANAAGMAALDLVDRLEDQLSIYRETSEVSRINRYAAEEPIEVEPRLFALLELSQALHARSRGAFDITSGPLSRVWGFTRRAGAMPAPADIAAALGHVGSQYLDLDAQAGTVRFLKPNLEINLGSIGKGYTLDRCAEFLIEQGIDDFLLHGGNSSVLARGTCGALAPGQGWLVGVRDPMRSGCRSGQLHLRNRALATSGSATQYFMHDGRRYGHVIDPRTGWPAQEVLSASVLAPTAAEADALATAFYVMGAERAKQYCDAHDAVSAVMFGRGAEEGTVEKHILQLDEHDWSQLDPV